MPKMKTYRGSAKRFRRVGTGKLRGFKVYASHLTDKKSAKRIRNLRKGTTASEADMREIDKTIPQLEGEI